jgi:hypothetical protein
MVNIDAEGLTRSQMRVLAAQIYKKIPTSEPYLDVKVGDYAVGIPWDLRYMDAVVDGSSQYHDHTCNCQSTTNSD